MLHRSARREGFSAMKALANALATGKKEPVQVIVDPSAGGHYDHRRHAIVVPYYIKRNMPEDLWLTASAVFDHEIAESEVDQACDVIRDRYGNAKPDLFHLANGVGDGLTINQWQAQRFPGSGLVLDQFWRQCLERDVQDQSERVESRSGTKHLIACVASYVGQGIITFDDAVDRFHEIDDLLLRAEEPFRRIEDLVDHPDPAGIAEESADIAEEIYDLLQYKEPPKPEMPPLPVDGEPCEDGEPVEGEPMDGEQEPVDAESDPGESSEAPEGDEEGGESAGSGDLDGEPDEESEPEEGESSEVSSDEGEEPEDLEADASEDAEESGDDADTSSEDEDGTSSEDGVSEEGDESDEAESPEDSEDGDAEEGGMEGSGSSESDAEGGSPESSGDPSEGDMPEQGEGEASAEGEHQYADAPEPLYAEDDGDIDTPHDMLRKELEKLFEEAKDDMYSREPTSTYITYNDPTNAVRDPLESELASPEEVESHREEYTRHGSTLADRMKQVFVVPGPAVTDGERYGTLDEGNLIRLVTRQYTAFKQTTPNERQDAAIALVVDESGSMRDGLDGTHRYTLGTKDVPRLTDAARQLTLTWAEALARLDVPLEITGFGARFRRIKSFDESFDDLRVKRQVAGIIGDGGTPMADAIEIAGTRLSERPEKLKILFVVTDGSPNNAGYGMAEIREACEETGIIVVNLGVALDNPNPDADWSHPWITVQDPKHLAQRASTELIDTIIKHS